MPSCSICIDDLKEPVSLPCGHIYCHACILRAVQAIWQYTSVHACPTCRASYSFSPIDPSSVPLFLRSHILPSIRRIYLDDNNSGTPNAQSSAVSSVISECERLRAEVAALKNTCGLWRRRAETHAAATLGLLGLVHSTRDEVTMVKGQNGVLHAEINSLRRRLNTPSVSDWEQQFVTGSPNHSHVSFPGMTNSEVPYRNMPHHTTQSNTSDPSCLVQAPLEPPAKRRRTEPSLEKYEEQLESSTISERAVIARRTPRRRSAIISSPSRS